MPDLEEDATSGGPGAMSDEAIAQRAYLRGTVLAKLVEQQQKTAEILLTVAGELKEVRESRRRQAVIVGVGTGLLVVQLVAALLLVFLTLGNRHNGQVNRANGQLLVDCTTPTPLPTPGNPKPHVHQCYEDGRRQQAVAITAIDCNVRQDVADALAIAFAHKIVLAPNKACPVEVSSG